MNEAQTTDYVSSLIIIIINISNSTTDTQTNRLVNMIYN